MGCSSNKEKKRKTLLKIGRSNITNEIKVVFLGDAGVGKSSIAQRFCYNKFSDSYDVTLGGVYFKKELKVQNGQTLSLHLWDTGGEERFRAMAPLYYRDALSAVLVYDVADQKSFESLNYWLRELDQKVKEDGMVLALAGNKCDVGPTERRVSYEDAAKFAKENNLIFYETSAKNDEGIQNLFQKLGETYFEKSRQQQLENQ